MWKYIKQYLFFAVIAGLLMVDEVLMDLAQPGIMSRIVDDGVLGVNNGGVPDQRLIWKFGLQMIGFALLGGVCGSLNNVFVHISSQNIGNAIRKECFARIMKLDFLRLDDFGIGSLVTRVTNDITQVQTFVSLFARGMIRTLFLTFGSMYFMFRLDMDFGLIVLCAFPFLLGIIVWCLWKVNPLVSVMQSQLDTINAVMQEDISGIRIMKACVREAYEKMRFGKANGELVRTQLKILVIFAYMNPLTSALMYVAVTAILLMGSFKTGQGTATPGNIMAAITYTTQLLNGILMFVMLFQNISRGFTSWRRVQEVLNSSPQLKDGDFDGETQVKGEIEFRDVSLSYPGSSQSVLSHINLTVHRGETVAVMGATGSGKTSLVNLIPRFYDAESGTVLVDGIDVRKYKQKALREKIAVAMQKSELFSMTVEENIAWGLPGADDALLKSAVSVAQAEEFISAMVEGYGTVVAERGMSLSGGQRQRISIARAVLKPAEIFIFDDSTSALDLKTEADFYRDFKREHPGSTNIIIAQRVASVRAADRIVILENGGILAVGAHEELMKSCQVYQDIYWSQIGEEVETA